MKKSGNETGKKENEAGFLIHNDVKDGALDFITPSDWLCVIVLQDNEIKRSKIIIEQVYLHTTTNPDTSTYLKKGHSYHPR